MINFTILPIYIFSHFFIQCNIIITLLLFFIHIKYLNVFESFQVV